MCCMMSVSSGAQTAFITRVVLLSNQPPQSVALGSHIYAWPRHMTAPVCLWLAR